MTVADKLSRVFPFLGWFHGYNLSHLRADLIGGLTVALVLVPQSMAYAQLAGLPAYYGLYASFLPPMVASLFGSSRQLATGPVAVVSLMTATALEPLATAGSESYIAYAILLALLVGVFQFLLGVFRLGLIVNFLSHPVVSGFTNAAAIIIASSQLSKLFGVTVEKGEHHYETIINVMKAALHYTHLPTLGLAVLAFIIMIVFRRLIPRLPCVLVAVIITTVISWAISFEKNTTSTLSSITSVHARELIQNFNETIKKRDSQSNHRVRLRKLHDSLYNEFGKMSPEVIDALHQLHLADVELGELKELVRDYREELRRLKFCLVNKDDGQAVLTEIDDLQPKDQGNNCNWRLLVGNKQIPENNLQLQAGGVVVGNIPKGLPAIRAPMIDFSIIGNLFTMAMIISLLGFMEAISIAKAMAARTNQRLDPNQELIGQGLSNIVGSFTQSYAVSGSFSRSAVNFQSGAVSGLSNVFSSMVVIITLLFLTPLLYYLPQSVLAAIIMMAVVGLINFKTFFHAWHAQKYDGIIGIITFVSTLIFAPHLDRGILIGVSLSLLLYLLRNTKPAIAMLSLHPDGTYRNRDRFGLDQCRHIAVIRYAGSVFFANVSYLENHVIDTVQSMPELRHILIVGNGINELDASGEEIISSLVDRLRAKGLKISFSGLNDSVLDVMRRTGLLAKIGEENIYRNASRALQVIWESAHEGSDEDPCPLQVVPLKRWPIEDQFKTDDEVTHHPPHPDKKPGDTE